MAVEEGFTLLQKPYSLEALRKSLSEAMQAPDAIRPKFGLPISRQSARA
jgi:hypothetical protein